MTMRSTVPYGGKLWWGKTLVNDHKFAKVSPANFSHSVASFVIFYAVNSPNFPTAKVSLHTV